MAEKEQTAVWQARMREAPSERHVAYCAGWDVRERPAADAVLIPYDLWVNQAHALMLRRVGIITDDVHRAIQRGLAAIEQEWREGRWRLDPKLEDVHINVERSLAARVGDEAAGWLHTARSRNDQTATDVRMFVRDSLLEFQQALVEFADELLEQAFRHRESLMPGMTHTQPSSPTTLGHFLCAHAQAFMRDADCMRHTYSTVNLSPLGAAAGYGTSWPIDRLATARHLGFDHVQENSIDCVSSRWEMETRATADLAIAANHFAMLAQDLILWSQPWIGFIAFSDRHVTGSSIMPQKRNPDFAEVTRAKAAVVAGILQSLFALNKGSVSGYNRDSQWTKYLFIDAVTEIRETPAVFCEAIEAMRVNHERLAEAAHEDFLVAVDLADTIARSARVPFRKAYEVTARLVRECEPMGHFTIEAVERALAEEGLTDRIPHGELEAAIDPARSVQKKTSTGGPALKMLEGNIHRVRDSAESVRNWIAERRRAIEKGREEMLQEIRV